MAHRSVEAYFESMLGESDPANEPSENYKTVLQIVSVDELGDELNVTVMDGKIVSMGKNETREEGARRSGVDESYTGLTTYSLGQVRGYERRKVNGS